MKRDPRLRQLSSEHHQALVLARRARRAAAAAEDADLDEVWATVRRRFDGELAPHFEVEERLLLPALGRAGHPELADRTLADHRAIRACIAGEQPLRDRLADLGRLLEAHVRFEERELFPVCERDLPSSDLDALARATAEGSASSSGGATRS